MSRTYRDAAIAGPGAVLASATHGLPCPIRDRLRAAGSRPTPPHARTFGLARSPSGAKGTRSPYCV